MFFPLKYSFIIVQIVKMYTVCGLIIRLHIQRVDALVYRLGADEPKCTPPGDPTAGLCMLLMWLANQDSLM